MNGEEAHGYLFFPQYDNRTTAVHIGIKQFDYLLKSIGLKQDIYTGKPFSLYALRHTALCMRLVLSGGQVNLFALARNAGTSVDMLERHYLRYLPNNEELARNIQIFSGQGQG